MASLNIRRDNGTQPMAPVPQTPLWEPGRLMRSLLNWDPFQEMGPMLQVPAGFAPNFEIRETKEAYVFKADVPGVKEADIGVTLTGNRLLITGKREAEKHEHSDTYYASERSYGEFSRAFTLPNGTDLNSIRADLKDGVLAVIVRKLPELQPKKIAVQSAVTKS